MRRGMPSPFLLLLALGLLPLAFARASDTPPQTVTHVDLIKYGGVWHEIARKPMFFQRNCTSDITAEYTPQNDGSIQIVNRCKKADGSYIEAKGHATVEPDSGNSKLSVSFFWPISKPYWILWQSADSLVTLIGSPNRKYLWLLSRTDTINTQTEMAALNYARIQGYEINDLIYTPVHAKTGAPPTATH